MLLTLALTLALGQTMYEWVDAQGESHFTDDLASVPKGVKVRTTDGADISTIESSPPPTKPAPTPQKPSSVDTGALARSKLERLQARLDDAKKKHELALLRYDGQCAEIRTRFGADEEARCLKRGRKAAAVPAPTYGALEKEVEQAQDAYRRAQVSGCAP